MSQNWAANADGAIDWDVYNNNYPPAIVTPEQLGKLALLEMHVAIYQNGRYFIVDRSRNTIPMLVLKEKYSRSETATFDTIDEAIAAVSDKDKYIWR